MGIVANECMVGLTVSEESLNNIVKKNNNCSEWLVDLKPYRYGLLRYWIHKVQGNDNWLLTCTGTEITNYNLCTQDLKVAEITSITILDNKFNISKKVKDILKTMKNEVIFSKKITK